MASAHGGDGAAALPAAGISDFVRQTRDLRAYGYRHVLRAPMQTEQAASLPNDLLWRLAKLMHYGQAAQDTDEQANLPAGYTYLLQLVAHDCVHTPTPFWHIPPGQIPARNARVARLRLDTLYGLGPVGAPLAFEAEPYGTKRCRLRLGPMKGAAPSDPPRDLARAAHPCPAAGGPMTDVLIADPRNEDHALLAQMTALWHMVHNALLRAVAPPCELGEDGARGALFAWGRAATALVCRRILRDDLLARLLDPVVHARYAAIDATGLLDHDAADPFSRLAIPLEFSHGAMRFAHTMVRPSYVVTGAHEFGIDEVLRHNSRLSPAAMPLDPSWIVDWSLFFDGLGPVPAANRSQRIAPRYVSWLNDSSLFPGPVPGWGLALHDLASACHARLWSVAALHRVLAARAAQVGWAGAFAGAPLADDAERRRALVAWLEAPDSDGFLIPGDACRIAADPPLPTFVQFEAAASASAGRRLGRLGSILVAETLFGAMLTDPLPGDTPGTTLGDALHALAAALGMRIAADAVLPEHATMAALIRFVAKVGGLGDATPPFVAPIPKPLEP